MPSAADGCPCELATPNPCYIHSNVTLFSKLGDRAAVFTTQCYGGQCVNGPENIRDFVTQSDYPGVAPTELCDDKQVVQDVSGLSVYCKNGSSSSNEPWNGAPAPVCSDPSAQLIPSSSSSMRTLQASIRMRGALSASQETQTCHPYYNSNGWLTYQTSRVGGQGATAIEFAPTVGGTAALSSFFLPVSSTKFEFTSPIDPSTCTLNMQAVAAPGISSTAPNFVNEKCDKLAAGAVLSNGLKTLSESKWNQEPTKLQDYYGADQSSWPWFVSATIKAKADNGVSLIGNEGATGKWIWGQKTAPNMIPPYLYSLGNITTGGTVFSARIPVEPTLSCCMPNIDWAKDMSDNWVPQKNGCKCQGNIGVSACFVGTCVSGDTKTEAPGMPASDCQNGTYKQFTGDIKLWTECCGQGSTNCEAYTDEPIDEPRDCREGDSYPITKRTYHRKARPYDTSPVIDCDPILIYQECKDDDSDRSVEKRARR